MPVDLALYQPDIPQNAGTLMRLSACLGFALHIVHPAGFALSDRNLRRAGMDYAAAAEIVHHDSFDRFAGWWRDHGRRMVLLTTRAAHSGYDFAFADRDMLLVGRETSGVPEDVAARADAAIRIPMKPGLRSINVALAAGLMMGEARRQTDGFRDLQ